MKYKWLLILLLPCFSNAQNLTVEKIMRDPKWIGTSPDNIFCDWNPDGKTSDSTYKISLTDRTPVKADYKDVLLQSALNNATYNKAYTQMVYSYRGDLYLTELKSNKTIRITQTEDAESNPSFVKNDEWITFTRSQNLYAWNTKTGTTEQLTNFIREAAAATTNTQGAGAFRGGGNFNRGGNNAQNSSAATT